MSCIMEISIINSGRFCLRKFAIKLSRAEPKFTECFAIPIASLYLINASLLFFRCSNNSFIMFCRLFIQAILSIRTEHFQANRPLLAHCSSSSCEIAFAKAAVREEPVLADRRPSVIPSAHVCFVPHKGRTLHEATSKDNIESPRVLRRLQYLRRWSHEQIKQVFP